MLELTDLIGAVTDVCLSVPNASFEVSTIQTGEYSDGTPIWTKRGSFKWYADGSHPEYIDRSCFPRWSDDFHLSMYNLRYLLDKLKEVKYFKNAF